MTVAHDGGAGNAVHATIVRFQALDHHLVLPHQGIDEQGRLDAIRVDDHHDALREIGRLRLDVEQLVQHDNRQVFTPHLDHPRLVGQGIDVTHPGLEGFDDVGQRQDVSLVADGNRHAVENGQRQGQANGHPGADPEHRVDFDPAAHRLDVAAHDIHAHTAAGNVRHLLGGRKTGFENQVKDLLIGHLLGNLQAAFACLGEDLVTRQTGAVVAHFDDDVAPLVIGLQGDRADRALARGNPRFR